MNELNPAASLWQTFLAFARFEMFITPSFLVIVYWLGAVGMPLFAVMLMRSMRRKIALPDAAGLPIWQRNKPLFLTIGAVMFVFAELTWRMMVETVLAYFQMRDALIGAASI